MYMVLVQDFLFTSADMKQAGYTHTMIDEMYFNYSIVTV
jgi:hypothetical protein